MHDTVTLTDALGVTKNGICKNWNSENLRMASWSTQKSVMACNWQKKVTCTYSVWDPTSTTLAEKLESVQRFAAKLYTKHWSDSPPTLITTLNWPTLCSHRSRQKALLCRCIIKNESIIPLSSSFSPPAHLNSHIHHPYSVCVPFCQNYLISDIISCIYRYLLFVEQPSKIYGRLTILTFT